MKFKHILGLLILSSFLISSCVSILKGSNQTLTINSNVDGAVITLDGVEIGTTPFIGEVPKNKTSLRIEKEGYKSYNLALSKSIDPLFFGNIITGGTIGSITDFATGAAYTYSPSSYQVELFSSKESSSAFLQRFELRKFAILNINDIAIDLGNDGGGYLETLIKLAGLDYNQESIELIRTKLDKSKGDEILFGKQVSEILDT